MIRGLHGLFYSNEPDALRDFLKTKLQLPHSDIGEGWLIFDVPEGDLGVHPTEDPHQSGKHNLSFYCDDIHGTVAGMKGRGVIFNQDIEDHGYGLVTYFSAPGGVQVQLYEPRYAKNRPAQAKQAAPKKAAGPKKKPAAKKKPAKKSRR